MTFPSSSTSSSSPLAFQQRERRFFARLSWTLSCVLCFLLGILLMVGVGIAVPAFTGQSSFLLGGKNGSPLVEESPPISGSSPTSLPLFSLTPTPTPILVPTPQVVLCGESESHLIQDQTTTPSLLNVAQIRSILHQENLAVSVVILSVKSSNTWATYSAFAHAMAVAYGRGERVVSTNTGGGGPCSLYLVVLPARGWVSIGGNATAPLVQEQYREAETLFLSLFPTSSHTSPFALTRAVKAVLLDLHEMLPHESKPGSK